MKRILLFFTISMVSLSAYAQWNIGADIQVYSPTGNMNQNITGTPAGLSFRGIRHSQNGWSFGGELGVAMYSNKSYNLRTENGDAVKIDEEDCFWTVHAITQRTLYQTDATRLYGEGRVGITTFFSSKTAVNDAYSDYNEFKVHGTAFNLGVGSGATFNMGQIFRGDRGNFNIDLGINVHSGTSSRYRNINTGDSAVKNLSDGDYQSLTHYVAYRIGVLFEL